jgi:hypothetical protein
MNCVWLGCTSSSCCRRRSCRAPPTNRPPPTHLKVLADLLAVQEVAHPKVGQRQEAHQLHGEAQQHVQGRQVDHPLGNDKGGEGGDGVADDHGLVLGLELEGGGRGVCGCGETGAYFTLHTPNSISGGRHQPRTVGSLNEWPRHTKAESPKNTAKPALPTADPPTRRPTFSNLSAILIRRSSKSPVVCSGGV